MSPTEIIADLRILAEDMNRLGTQLATNKSLYQKYSKHGYELLTGAYVVTAWAAEIEQKNSDKCFCVTTTGD
jgi:hypothetical protein